LIGIEHENGPLRIRFAIIIPEEPFKTGSSACLVQPKDSPNNTPPFGINHLGTEPQDNIPTNFWLCQYLPTNA
jgi:hypothetical protein